MRGRAAFVARIGLAVGRAVLELDSFAFARRLTAFEHHIDDLGDRRAGCNAVESAIAQHCRFERELRRKPGAHLFLGPRDAGFIVKDDIAAVGAALDAIGDAAQLERASAECDVDLAADFGARRRHAGAAAPAPSRANQCAIRSKRGHHKARASGKSSSAAKCVSPELDQFARRIGRQSSVAKRCVNSPMAAWMKVPRSAAPGAASTVSSGAQPQNVLGVDRVGIAQPVLDLGDRKTFRPRRTRRLRRRLWRRRDLFRPIELARPSRDNFRRAPIAACQRVAGDRGKALNETRRHCRRAGDLGGAVKITSRAPSNCAKSWAERPMRRSGKIEPELLAASGG